MRKSVLPISSHGCKLQKADNPPPKIALFGERTSKIRRAYFPVRADRGEVLRQKFCMLSRNLPQNEGKTTAERAGFSP